MKDFPADQASRWSSDSNIPPQVLILENLKSFGEQNLHKYFHFAVHIVKVGKSILN